MCIRVFFKAIKSKTKIQKNIYLQFTSAADKFINIKTQTKSN